MKELSPGTAIGGVEVRSLRSVGGSSQVYAAVDIATGEERALKVISGPLSDDGRRNVRRECELLMAAPHPGIVALRARVDHERDVCLITDWVRGVTLAERFEAGASFSVSESLYVAGQLGAALDHLHEAGVVHRDVSPANVMIDDALRVTLIDLGIGQRADEQTVTQAGVLAGTPRYLAPELIRGDRASPRSDQYSVAMLLHEMLSGIPALPSGEVIATTLHHQLHTVPDPLDEIDPAVPTAVADAVLRALSKDPESRFASIGDFIAAARVTTLEPSPEAAGRSEQWLNGSRGRGWVTGVRWGLVVLLPLLLIGAYALFADRDTSTQQSVTIDIEPTPSPQAPRQETPTVGETDHAAQEPSTPEPVASTPTGDPGSAGPAEASGTAETLPNAIGWSTGMAAALECNLLSAVDFENGAMLQDFFSDPPDSERIVDHGGVDDSAVLVVGAAGQFGLVGEAVSVVPGSSYTFRSWLQRNGEDGVAEMGVGFLDADYEQLNEGAEEVKLAIEGSAPQIAEVLVTAVPAGASFAVPYLYKDASDDVLLVDELVFGPTSGCADALRSIDEGG